MIIFTISLLCLILSDVSKTAAQACDYTCPLYHTVQTQPMPNNRGARPGVGRGVVRGVSGVELSVSPVCSLNVCI